MITIVLVILANSSPVDSPGFMARFAVLPAMTSTVIKAKFKGTRDEKATYVANICAPRTPMVSGMPSIMNIDENNICNIVVENCAPYDVTLERDDSC
jgi:hypothetical protein